MAAISFHPLQDEFIAHRDEWFGNIRTHVPNSHLGDSGYNAAPHSEYEENDNASDQLQTEPDSIFDERDDAERALARLVGLEYVSVRIVGGEQYTGRTDENEDKGFWDSIGGLFFPDVDRATCAEGLRRGGYLVTLSNISADEYDRAVDILVAEHSIDIDERAKAW